MVQVIKDEKEVTRNPVPDHPRFKKIISKIRELKDTADKTKNEHDPLVKEAKTILQDIYGNNCSLEGDGLTVTMYSSGGGETLVLSQFKKNLLKHISADVLEQCLRESSKQSDPTIGLRVEYAKEKSE